MSDEFSEFVSRYDFPREQVVKYRKLQNLVVISTLSLLPGALVSVIIVERYLPLQIWGVSIPNTVGWLIVVGLLVFCLTLVAQKKRAPIDDAGLVYYEVIKAREAYNEEDWDALQEHINEASSEINKSSSGFLALEEDLIDTYSDEWNDENRNEHYLLSVFEEVFQQIAEVEQSKQSLHATTEEIESKSERDIKISSLEIITESFSELPINPHVAAWAGIVVVGLWLALSGISGAVGVLTAGLGIIEISQNGTE